MKIKIEGLRGLVERCLRTKYDEEDIKRVADVVMFGQLSGKTSHGLVRLVVGGESVMAMKPEGKPEIKNVTKLSSLIEGKGNSGMLVGALAMEEVIRLAKENGFGLVGTRGSQSTSGSLSYYLEKVAREDLIGTVMAQSPVSTPPFGGIEPLFGTNPIGFGIPAEPKPLIFDMGTSAISYGAILKAKATGQKLPEGVALDSEGIPTTDPAKAIDGATLPFDGSYKGAGLAMMVEILAGTLPGADFSGLNPDGGWGNTFLAFSPALLQDVEEFKTKVKKMVERVRTSKTKDGNPVRIVGESTLKTRDEVLRNGEVEVDEELIAAAKAYLEIGKT